jgi:hypothetical protein
MKRLSLVILLVGAPVAPSIDMGLLASLDKLASWNTITSRPPLWRHKYPARSRLATLALLRSTGSNIKSKARPNRTSAWCEKASPLRRSRVKREWPKTANDATPNPLHRTVPATGGPTAHGAEPPEGTIRSFAISSELFTA